MTGFVQDPRFEIKTPLAPNSLLLIGLEGQEAVSQPFAFQLRLAAKRGAKIPFDKLLGQELSVRCSFYADRPRHFCGVAAGIFRDDSDDRLSYYTIELVPAFALLKNNFQCRVFQDQTVPDILRAVLGKLNVEFSLRGKYPKHNYCVQYRESDFAFACRLMEEEGMYFYFVHAVNGHRMVIADRSAHGPACPQESSIIYDNTSGALRDGTYVDSWREWQGIAPSRHTLWDHSFQLTGQNLAAESTIQKTVHLGSSLLHFQLPTNESLQVFDFPGTYAQRFDAVGYNGQSREQELSEVHKDNQRTVKLRMAQRAAASVRIEGASNSPYLTTGYTIRLQRHETADGYYFLTRVRHRFSLPGYRGGISDDIPYKNDFECIPTGLPYLPPLQTPVPRIHGLQTATVVGPQGEEIFTDKYGRVQVQFQWQAPGANSCWVRVGQSWAGGQWGGIQIPRVGQEVIVSFLEGDPDAPLITGNVYNSKQMPPFDLPQYRTRMALKSQSTPSGDSSTFSGLAIEDQKGSEHVQIHSERDLTHQTERNHYLNTGNSYYHRTQSTRFRHTGSIPGTGGGGGSGGGGDSDDYYTGPFDWQNGDATASVGIDVAFTVGIDVNSATGISLTPNIGPNVAIAISPLSFVSEIPGLSSVFASPVGALCGVLTAASSSVNFGPETDINYGPNITVQHGPTAEVTGWNDTTKIPTIVAATVLATAIAGTVIEAGCLENEPEALTSTLVITDFIGLIALGKLTALEQANFDITNSEEEDAKAQQLDQMSKKAEEVAKLAIAPSVKQAADSAGAAAKSASDAAKEAAAAAGSAGKAADSATAAAESAAVPNRIRIVNGNYVLSARGGNAQLASTYNAEAVPPSGGNVAVLASGPPEINGSVLVGGSNSVVIRGGNAAIGVSNTIPDVGQVTVSSGGIEPESSIYLQRGPTGRNIAITMEGITIDGMAEEEPGIVTIKTMEGAISIVLDPEAEMLTITAPNIRFNAEGFIQFNANSIDFNAEAEFDVMASSIDMEADADLTLLVDETEFGMTAAGFTMEGMTQECEIETSIEINTLTEELMIDAEASFVIAVTMIE